jgi:hypothetical protein
MGVYFCREPRGGVGGIRPIFPMVGHASTFYQYHNEEEIKEAEVEIVTEVRRND